ncbi:MAG: amidohydrolase family protein [Armatimonadota bacterium]|jgi:predicted TIM-barrel fold metal-dependent hydrolase
MKLSGIIDMVTTFGIDRTREVDWGLDTLLAVMREHKVERAYTCSLRAVYYAGPQGNDETLRACEQHQVLRPVAVLDPRRFFDQQDEARRRFEQGCGVFRFFPGEQGWPLEFLPFVKICETLAELGARAIVPAAGYGEATRVAKLLGHLELPVLLIGGSYVNIGELMAVLADSDTMYCDAHMQDGPFALEGLMERGGEDRVIFGSNSPDREFLAPLLMARHAEITDEQRRAYLRGNALAFLGEDAP